MSRDIGLQPERTALSWLRTQMVIIGLGMIKIKVGLNSGALSLIIAGVLLIVTSFCIYLFTRMRFIKLFNNMVAISKVEFVLKVITSTALVIASLSYIIFLMSQL